jgi:hypothetical protein
MSLLLSPIELWALYPLIPYFVRKVLSSLRPFTVRENVERLGRAHVGVSENALDVFVFDASFVQSGAETATECMPTEPCAVDVLRNVPT